MELFDYLEEQHFSHKVSEETLEQSLLLLEMANPTVDTAISRFLPLCVLLTFISLYVTLIMLFI